MRRLLAAFGVVALVGIATPALASPSPAPPVSISPTATPTASPSPSGPVPLNDWCGGANQQYINGPIHSEEWPATWAESTVTGNWYISTVNSNGLTFTNCAASGEYLELYDLKSNNNCVTVNSASPYQLYDYTCKSGRASQEWGVVYYGTDLQGNSLYALFNQWIEENVSRCDGGRWNLVITASGDGKTNAGLHMACPTTSGQPDINQQWYTEYLN